MMKANDQARLDAARLFGGQVPDESRCSCGSLAARGGLCFGCRAEADQQFLDDQYDAMDNYAPIWPME